MKYLINSKCIAHSIYRIKNYLKGKFVVIRDETILVRNIFQH